MGTRCLPGLLALLQRGRDDGQQHERDQWMHRIPQRHDGSEHCPRSTGMMIMANHMHADGLA